jgi:CubicO group peptidase (beta-lactamase class C family)
MNKRNLLCFVLAYMVGCSQQEIKLPTAKPEQVGLSSDRFNQIKPLIQRYIDEKKLPGIITMIARHGKVVCFEKYGLMGIDKPMQLNAIFRIASMTKPITSVAAMMLYEEGHFQLDDPVAKYIPEFKDLKVFSCKDKNGIHVEDQRKPMTISDLLSHTSGLGSGAEDSPVDSMYRTANLSGGTLKDMIQKLAKIPLKYQPGTRWQYSRSSDVLGYLVEVISGKPLDIFFKERIFKPLKMTDTDYSVPKDKLNRVSAVYGLADSVGIKVLTDPEINNVSGPVKFLSGNGGLVSTATDYMIFSQMLLNKGEYNGVRLLKSKTVDLMTSNHISNMIMPDDDFLGPLMLGMGFGFGFAILQDNIRANTTGSKGSYWWSGAGNTYFYVDPKEELILILMTQFVPSYYYPINKEFRELVYQAIAN